MLMPTPVQTAGIFTMPLSVYILDPAPAPSLNAGAAHILLTQSPLHAWVQHPRLNPAYQSDESSRLDLGTIAHALLLEDDESRVAVIDAEDWRTKAAKEARDEARAAGKIPILPKDMATVRAMVKVAIDTIFSSELCEPWMEAIPEQTLIWEHHGIWCRSRPDKLTPDGRVYFDYKSVATTAHPGMFGRGPLINHGYDLQAVLGIQGVMTLKQPQDCKVIFVVQEIEPPYSVSFVSMAPQFIAIAEQRLAYAQDRWKICLAARRWPGYPSRVAYVEAPGYYGMETYESMEGQ